MEKIKRFFALLLIIVLLAMYISTLVFAIIDDPATMSFLKPASPPRSSSLYSFG